MKLCTSLQTTLLLLFVETKGDLQTGSLMNTFQIKLHFKMKYKMLQLLPESQNL